MGLRLMTMRIARRATECSQGCKPLVNKTAKHGSPGGATGPDLVQMSSAKTNYAKRAERLSRFGGVDNPKIVSLSPLRGLGVCLTSVQGFAPLATFCRPPG